MDLLSMLFRWLHIVAGILWIGLLYWFNFVNIPFAGTMDGETKTLWQKADGEKTSRCLAS